MIPETMARGERIPYWHGQHGGGYAGRSYGHRDTKTIAEATPDTRDGLGSDPSGAPSQVFGGLEHGAGVHVGDLCRARFQRGTAWAGGKVGGEAVPTAQKSPPSQRVLRSAQTLGGLPSPFNPVVSTHHLSFGGVDSPGIFISAVLSTFAYVVVAVTPFAIGTISCPAEDKTCFSGADHPPHVSQ